MKKDNGPQDVRRVTTRLISLLQRREGVQSSLGRQAYLKAKAVGENSMSGKPGCQEAAKRQARRGPDGMVKAALPEPQCPNSKASGRQRRMTAGCSPEDRAGILRPVLSTLGELDRL